MMQSKVTGSAGHPGAGDEAAESGKVAPMDRQSDDYTEERVLKRPGTELMIRRMSEMVPVAPVVRQRQKIIDYHSPQQDVVQAFRALRTMLLQMAGPRNFSTLVTSVRPGHGASFVARNLAAALAFDESRTALLIDCNRDRPSLNGLLVSESSRGLTDLLDNPRHVMVSDIIYSTGIPRLRAIPVGNQRRRPVEYFTSMRMRAFLEVLTRRYNDRYIIVDSPAIQDCADARILADWCDYIVLVARYGETTREELLEAAATIPQGKFAGVVFNDFDPAAAHNCEGALRVAREK